ncbi:MAG TPA: FtsX-like permease family protein, partial [Acidobacteriota bacterium]|nr:FtsX-like permease family protein [Acidobacteriota bacterium]
MRFIVEMARREIRASWKRLVFFFLCIAIGVGSVVAIRSIIRNFNEVFTSEARELMGADIQLSTSRPWGPEVLQAIERLPRIQGRAQTDESTTMLRPAAAGEGALMVEIKSVDATYPLYGKIELQHGESFQHAMLENGGVIVARAVLERLQLQKGDPVKMGESTFVIRGVLEREPGIGGFRFGPRVIISREEMEKAGLSGFGSRIRRKILLKLPESEVERLTNQLRKQFKSNLINVRSYKESQERLDVQFTRAENFLSLTGLVILVLGGIGISSVTRVFIDQKKKSIAVLKCLGATGGKVITVYLVQVVLLGIAGSIAGIALAKAAVSFIGINYASILPPGMSYSLRHYAVLQGFAFGILVTLLFAALPLLRIRHIKPNVLLRDELEPQQRTSRIGVFGKLFHNADWLRRLTAVLVVTGLILLSTWQAGSLKVGAFFLIGLLFTLGVIHVTARLLIWAVRKARTMSNWSTRYAISSLSRPGNQTNVILVAVGIGSFFILAILSLKTNLLQEMNWDARTNMPNMYLIDIQRDQVSGVTQIIR